MLHLLKQLPLVVAALLLLACPAVAEESPQDKLIKNLDSNNAGTTSQSTTGSQSSAGPQGSTGSQNTTESQKTTTSHPVKLDNCTFDAALHGDWMSTVWGPVQLNELILEVKLAKLGIDDVPDLKQFQCYKAFDDGSIILKSTPFSIYQLELALYTCVKFSQQNEDLYKVSIYTGRDINHRNIPGQVKLISGSHNTYTQLCQSESVVDGYLIRSGHELEAATGCPQILNGQFNLTYSNETDEACPGGATLTTCEQPNTLTISNTCNNSTNLSNETESYTCMALDGFQLTLLKNETEAGQTESTNPFSCLLLTVDQTDNGTLGITQMSQACGQVWSHPGEGEIESEFRLEYTDECKKEVTTTTTTTTTPAPNTTTTVNTTTTDSPNVTDANGNGTSPDDGPKDAAVTVMSNGFVLTTMAATVALVLTNHFP